MINHSTRVIVQGFTGRRGSEFARDAIELGTNIVGGVRPGKGGSTHLDRPIFDTVQHAIDETGADASIVFVPAPHNHHAVIEAVDARMPIVVCPAEGYAVHDMIRLRHRLSSPNCITRVVGPNCPGIIIPGSVVLGIMPEEVFSPGRVGIVTRAGTLTYECADQLTQAGIGQSMVIGVGADPVVGTTLTEAADYLLNDDATDALLVIGEIGGSAEEDFAQYLKQRNDAPGKPVFACIAGRHAPTEQRMGHAGAIISGGVGTAASKEQALKSAGVTLVPGVTQLARIMKTRLATTAPS